MKLKYLFASSALAIAFATVPAFAQPIHDCGDSVTCNNGSINKTDTSNTQTIGDNLNNNYAQDSAYATGGAANVEIGDTIAQGGTGGNSTSTGNVSTNNNQSNAQIGANSQTNGNISNNVTGGNITSTGGNIQGGNLSQGPQTGGSFTQGALTGGSNSQGDITGGSNNQAIVGGSNFQDIRGGGNTQGDITGGSAQGGNVTGGTVTTNGGISSTSGGVVGDTVGGNVSGGTATTNSGSVNSQGGDGGTVGDTTANSTGGSSNVQSSGNSRNNNSARGGSQRQNSSANNSGGNSRNSQGNRQQTTVNANTNVKHAANSAWAPQLNGYGPGNCFGDTNPSGSFSAGMQTFGWGVTAGSSKASNVCALAAVGGPRAAAAYLAAMDPNAHRALVAAGVVTTPSRVKAQQEASALAQVEASRDASFRVCEMRNGQPYIVAKRGRSAEAVHECMNILDLAPRNGAPIAAASSAPVGRSCPATHPVYVEGRGCRK